MNKLESGFSKQNLIALAVFVFFIFGCSMFGGGSPIASYKAFIEAAKNKDAATMKKYLSADALLQIKTMAQYGKKNEDEFLISFNETIKGTPEYKDEKIATDGKTATLEVKLDSSKDWKTVYFSKESSWKIELSKPTKTSDTANTSNSNSSSNSTDYPTRSDSSTPTDTSPVTISASELVSEAQSGGLEKYNGRMMTITGAELWEIQYSMLHIGSRGGSYSSGYIICNGSFSEYMPYASKISDLRKQYKSPGATIKGTFSRVVRDSGYTQVHLSPCVLSNLEK